MRKVILLGVSDQFSFNAMKILYFLIAVTFLAVGLIRVISNPDDLLIQIVGSLLIGYSLYAAFIAVAAFSAKSKYAPRVQFSDDFIEFKTGVFKKPIRLYARDIMEVELHTYRMNFNLKSESSKHIRYLTTPFTSKRIKKAMIEYADSKGIQLV